jgi:2,3-bisphosphoglycerate-independent phosphoglycerate mutase
MKKYSMGLACLEVADWLQGLAEGVGLDIFHVEWHISILGYFTVG